jgi:hypothetical protein
MIKRIAYSKDQMWFLLFLNQPLIAFGHIFGVDCHGQIDETNANEPCWEECKKKPNKNCRI